MKIVKFIVFFLFLQACFCFCAKKPLPELNLKEYDATTLLELIHDHLNQYAGYMPGDLHLQYTIKTMNDYDTKYKNTIFFSYQMVSIFDITEDRTFFLPCDLQYALQFWGDEEDTRDEAVRELYRYLNLIDFSEEGKNPLPKVKERPRPTETALDAVTENNPNTLSSITYTDVVVESNITFVSV